MTTATQTEGHAQIELRESVIEAFRPMITMVPDMATGGAENIIMQILSAEEPLDLESPWTDQDRGLPLGKVLDITAISKAVSDHKGGLGYYLIIEATDVESGEVGEYTSGALSIVAQLVKAYAMEWFPLLAKAVQAEKPTSNGTYPQHLEIIQRNTGKKAK